MNDSELVANFEGTHIFEILEMPSWIPSSGLFKPNCLFVGFEHQFYVLPFYLEALRSPLRCS